MCVFQLQEKNENMKEQVDELWERIHNLWNRLELEESERQDFESCHKGHKHSILSGLKDEILRCEQLKFANLQRFVEGARKELTEQWNRCYFSQQQREAFPHYHEGTVLVKVYHLLFFRAGHWDAVLLKHAPIHG